MTDDELVERWFPCDCGNCLTEYGGHYDWCQTQNSDAAHNLAAAVREAVLKRVRVCDRENCKGGYYVNADDVQHECERCHGRGILFGAEEVA